MKHKKLAAMFGSGILTVSGLVGCVYGPEPSESLKQEFTLDLEAGLTGENDTEQPTSQAQENAPERTAS